ncbi:LysR family transcriptional regulator [Paludibacterium purpuratum]|uniref:DNA-binding transcriptional LysR family regulator n=1 Tax=Paludibacterium purpuratum TaxID=1144873 RepID=A0A4R7B9I8_9NEIS|nr:LysR family transcriptional regulator [Paludibacterium purpuratum]TDR81544.1 DNA-binding transcriptional LysR family regulator [Paludibacterium purpuratum]
MDADLLKTFLAVIRQGSFIGAAEQIGRTQSAVSQQIQRLENLLGGPLLIRTSRAIRLTAAGERFVEYAQRMVDLAEEARRTVHGLAVQQTLRVGIVEDLAGFVLAEVLQRLRAEVPQLRLDIHSASTRELLPQLGFRYDVVVGIKPSHARGGTELLPLPLCWLGEWRGGTVPLALHAEGCGMRHAATNALDNAGIAWDAAMIAEGILPNIAVVRAGLAVTVLAEGLCPPDLPRCVGLPALPSLSLRLFAHDEANIEAVETLGRVLRETLSIVGHQGQPAGSAVAGGDVGAVS